MLIKDLPVLHKIYLSLAWQTQNTFISNIDIAQLEIIFDIKTKKKKINPPFASLSYISKRENTPLNSFRTHRFDSQGKLG